MKDLGLDFGLLIAYLIPGSLTFWGLSFWYTELQVLIKTANQKDGGAAALAVITVLSLVIGLLLSVIRTALIDKSFATDLSWIPLAKGSALALPPIRRVDPIFSRLAATEKLAVYLEAKASDKRPYQFYGNTILALVIFGSCYFFSIGQQRGLNGKDIGLIVVLLVACFYLYLAARNSHARFMMTVEDLNSERQNAP